jgi:hypothetical protein
VRLTWGLGLVATLAVLVGAAGRADAYPEFQFATGASRCSECHLSPVGGGLLSDYGRGEAGDTISGGAGDGALLHGLVEPPGWLAIGGDVRVAGLGRQGRGTEAAVFPMQADVYARIASHGLSIDGTFGVLAMIRDANPIAERLGSREHYVMYEPESKAWYLRAGRFFPAYGLRLLDHTAYVRRFTGQHSLEESYAIGGGARGESWELHASLLTPIEVAPVVGRHGWGYAIQYERFTGAGTGSVGLSSKGLHDDDGNDVWLGPTFKRWLDGPRLLLSAELDGGLQTLTGGDVVARLAGYAALDLRPGSRWSVGAAAHVFDPDVRVNGQTGSAVDAHITVFPRAHWELQGLIRGELAGLQRGSAFGMLQLHYYL